MSGTAHGTTWHHPTDEPATCDWEFHWEDVTLGCDQPPLPGLTRCAEHAFGYAAVLAALEAMQARARAARNAS